MQDILYRFDVSEVLVYRVAQLIFSTIYVLCPAFAVLAAVDPSFVVLGFNDKDAIDRYDYMVNLCRISVMLNKQVVDDFILVLRKFL